MRKLKLQMQITTDGFVAGANGALDWMTPPTDERQLQLLTELTNGMDTIVMGHHMVEGFTGYWEHVVNNQPDSPEYPYAKIFVDTPKIIFSRTATEVKGQNCTIENGDLSQKINSLKALPGKDIIVYGGANFVSELIKNNLIDDLYLFVNPVAIGAGLRIFEERVNLKLVDSVAYSNGIVANHYQPII